MKIMKPYTVHGIVNRTKNSVFCYQAWPTVARDEKGTLYAVASGFRLSHVCPFGKTVMYKSYDEGKTWTPPIVINDTYLDDRDAGILYMGNGRMLVTWFTHSAHEYSTRYKETIAKLAPDAAREAAIGMLGGYEFLPKNEKLAGSYVIVSEDYGMTWSDRISIPISSPHGPSMCADGSLVYLGTKYYDDDGVHIKQKDRENSLYRSTDGGYTWVHVSDIKDPEWLSEKEYLCEYHMIELEDGTLFGAFRVEGHPLSIATTVSRDGGSTWSDVKRVDVSGSPPHLLMHSSGALICAFSRREAPFGVRAMISYDKGENWSDEYIIDERSLTWDFGYPSTVELDDGSLMTVYYQRHKDDAYCSILYTKWRLEVK